MNKKSTLFYVKINTVEIDQNVRDPSKARVEYGLPALKDEGLWQRLTLLNTQQIMFSKSILHFCLSLPATTKFVLSAMKLEIILPVVVGVVGVVVGVVVNVVVGVVVNVVVGVVILVVCV